jgi:hypothetical protein
MPRCSRRTTDRCRLEANRLTRPNSTTRGCDRPATTPRTKGSRLGTTAWRQEPSLGPCWHFHPSMSRSFRMGGTPSTWPTLLTAHPMCPRSTSSLMRWPHLCTRPRNLSRRRSSKPRMGKGASRPRCAPTTSRITLHSARSTTSWCARSAATSRTTETTTIKSCF